VLSKGITRGFNPDEIINLGIGAKVGVLLLVMLAIGGINVAVVYYYEGLSAKDSQIINVAGRQRMLSQEMAKLVNAIDADEQGLKDSLRNAIHEYDKSLIAMRDGGETMDYQLPSAPKEMMLLFEENQVLWLMFKENAERVLETEDKKSQEFRTARQYINSNNLALRGISNQIVTEFTRISDEKTATLKRILILLFLFNTGIFAAGFYVSKKNIGRPLKAIAAEADRIAAGDLSAREFEGAKRKDEIGELSRAFNDLIDNVAGPVQELGIIAEQIAEGDLTQEVDIEAKGDIGKLVGSFKTMVSGLKEVLTQVKETSLYLAAASQQMASASDIVNDTVEDVSAAVHKISEGAQNQASKMFIIASNSGASASSAEEARKTAVTGGESAQGAIEKMDVMHNSVDKTAAAIRGLGNRSKEIGQIVDLITSVADQTNLLALNAAIEAARAGDHGRGFAVVANEVKKLAEESREAADKIAKIIKEIQSETELSVQSMESVTVEVKEGTVVVNSAGSALKQIAAMVNKLAADTQNSVKAIREVSGIINENAGSSRDVAIASEKLAARMGEVSKSSVKLAELAHNLQSFVERFKLDSTDVIDLKEIAEPVVTFEEEPDIEEPTVEDLVEAPSEIEPEPASDVEGEATPDAESEVPPDVEGIPSEDESEAPPEVEPEVSPDVEAEASLDGKLEGTPEEIVPEEKEAKPKKKVRKVRGKKKAGKKRVSKKKGK